MSLKGISVVVPVFNSEKNLKILTDRLQNVLSSISELFEIIFVNDGSRDESWKGIQDLVHTNKGIRGINLMRNFGQHNALLAGIRQAQYGLVLTLDDDLQHPPEEIPKLLEKLQEGYDVVYGAPKESKHSHSRNIASRITRASLRFIMKIEIANKVSAFRLFRTYLRDAFANYNAPHPSLDVLLSWATTRFSYVEVQHDPRKVGKSTYTFLRLLNHAITMATGYSTMPLRLASFLGFLFTLFGIFVLVYVLIRYMISGSPVAGFPFLASTIAIFSGVQLFALGIIGEYLARMYTRMMDKPAYVIQGIEGVEKSKSFSEFSNMFQEKHARSENDEVGESGES